MIDSPAVLVDIACDYLRAVLSGQPVFASTVADNYGAWRVSRGMATLLVFLAADAAEDTNTTPEEIIETMRKTYARRIPEGETA
jgi:hypothetical protein